MVKQTMEMSKTDFNTLKLIIKMLGMQSEREDNITPEAAAKPLL